MDETEATSVVGANQWEAVDRPTRPRTRRGTRRPPAKSKSDDASCSSFPTTITYGRQTIWTWIAPEAAHNYY